MLNNKKAQGLPITTLILIILGIVVLVVLIIGFTKGWDSVRGWFIGGAGTERYISECAVACSTNNIAGWCDKKYDVTDRGGTQSCNDLTTAILADPSAIPAVKASSKKINACNPAIPCTP